jgi:hypothetical protein
LTGFFDAPNLPSNDTRSCVTAFQKIQGWLLGLPRSQWVVFRLRFANFGGRCGVKNRAILSWAEKIGVAKASRSVGEWVLL